ncbi:hypothetical protein SAMN06265375_10218 [Muriicola jejuensis]|uniref:Uncharacterized protein n=1 Tax=Muriicola jejuensis TaxID=504488 RepID=A0A6P0UGR9_9FLAO|nr:hypothetical protein [Muriicola jejuensis]NER10998.1 hypothetical protein [Muriicola jejuensis]SMP14886.1 hypothetical protein SAMN06265375_10218 [Muriicola jejuensis]
MIAVLTGDIVNSGLYPGEKWMPVLREVLGRLGAQPEEWDIYRGDEFQVKTPLDKALETALLLKSSLASFRNLDVRLAIGLGDETFSGQKITESNGSAYRNSGRLFSELKSGRQSLALRSKWEEKDEVINLMLRLALSFMDEWTPVSAETVAWTLLHPHSSQEEMATHFGIRQSAVSQRQKRARTDLVFELLDFYRTFYKE